MQIITPWRNILSIKNHIIPSLSHFSAFHSTPCTCLKWHHSPEVIRKGQTFKNHIKYMKRRRPSFANKGLKIHLYNSGSSRFSFTRLLEKESKMCGTFYEDIDNQPKQTFRATFGSRHYTWPFSNMRGTFSEHSTYGFEWREHTKRTNTNKWKTASVESSSEMRNYRTILGLPPTGRLNIEDVKDAFRLSALKWHPDKHQGPSQAMAEEKFKQCADAYKTLCNALSPE